MIKGLISRLTGHRIRYYGSRQGRRLYLTFDDGPHAEHTLPLLALLAQHRVRATFFVVGREACARPDIVHRIVADGHALGNHTITHPRMDFLADPARDFEIDGMDAFLSEFDHRSTHPFRPPYGGVSISLFAYGLRSGRQTALWSEDSLDYKYTGAEVVRRFATTPPKSGDILLFHDDGGAARDSLTSLLPKWLAEGFTFATFDELGAA